MLKTLLDQVELLERQMSLALDDDVDIRLHLTYDGAFYTVSILYNNNPFLTDSSFTLVEVCSRLLKVLRNEV